MDIHTLNPTPHYRLKSMYLRCDLATYVPQFSPKKILPPLKHRPSYGLDCSVFKLIRFCRYPAPAHAAPFLYKNEEKTIHFCAFTLLSKTDKKLSVFVIYGRSHYSVFVKLQKGAEALTLISPLKLSVANSLIRKTDKT